MKAQQRYGSGINLFLSQNPSIKPTPGMGATLLMWSDRAAYTVMEISKNGRQLKAIKDIAHRVDNRGEKGRQEYVYETDKSGNARVEEYTLRKNGQWLQKGQKGCQLILGSRETYYDYSF